MKQLLVFLFLLCSAVVSAQDVIVKKDGSTIVCRVVELTDSEITYKKWSDLNGSNYVMDRSLASAINYENGKKVSLSEATNLYTPNNQNDGTQQYNDRALLQLDHEMHGNIYKKKAMKKIIIGLAGGVLLGSIGIANSAGDGGMERGLGFGACGVAWAATWSLLSIPLWNEAKRTKTYSLYKYEKTLTNGSSLSLSADLLRDNTLGQNTLGLGLRYNF